MGDHLTGCNANISPLFYIQCWLQYEVQCRLSIHDFTMFWRAVAMLVMQKLPINHRPAVYLNMEDCVMQ